MQLKGDHQIVIVVIAFFLGFVIRGIIETEQVPISEIVTGLVTILAVYFGASYAFKLQNDKAEKEKIKKEIEASNRTIYTVYDIWNTQKHYQKEIILPYEGKDDAWLNMSPTVKGMHESITFDVSNLDFLLSSGKPDIYQKLLLEEKRYRIILSLIEERSKLVFEELNPKMESFGCAPGVPIDMVKLEKHLGFDLVNKLKKLTEAIISHADENTASLEELHTNLHDYLTEIYPNEKFITVKFQLEDE
jgi:hypothetical protein